MNEYDAEYYPFRGLPVEIVDNIYWNKKSINTKKGTNFVIVYTSGRIKGFENIRYPGAYFKQIYKNKSLEYFKRTIKCIYAKRYDLESTKYFQIWDNISSLTLPNEELKSFPHSFVHTGQFLDLFLSDVDFALIYLSLYYPFDYDSIIRYWDGLIKGNAHYSEFTPHDFYSQGEIYSPQIGLCFNQNIKWNSKLRARFDYGVYSPYYDKFIGIENEPVWYDEINNYDNIIPLDTKKEIEYFNKAVEIQFEHDPNNNEDDFPLVIHENDIKKIDEEHFYLDFFEFRRLYRRNKLKVLLNKSIWDNTLSKIINTDFCELIFSKFHYLKSQGLYSNFNENEYSLWKLKPRMNLMDYTLIYPK